jgi:hypothetical protein
MSNCNGSKRLQYALLWIQANNVTALLTPGKSYWMLTITTAETFHSSCHCITVLSYYHTVVWILCYGITMLSDYHTTVLIPCYRTTMLSDHHTSCYRTTVLSYYHAIWLPYYRTNNMLSDCHTVVLSNNRAVVLPRYRITTVVWILCYRTICSPYSRAIELPCCRITKLSDYHTTVLILCYRNTVLSEQRSAQIKEPCAHVASERYVCH